MNTLFPSFDRYSIGDLREKQAVSGESVHFDAPIKDFSLNPGDCDPYGARIPDDHIEYKIGGPYIAVLREVEHLGIDLIPFARGI